MLPSIPLLLFLLGFFCLQSVSALQCYTGMLNRPAPYLVEGECYIDNMESRCATNDTNAFCASSAECERDERVNCCDSDLCNDVHISQSVSGSVESLISLMKKHRAQNLQDERPTPVAPHRHPVRTDTGNHGRLKCYTGFFKRTLKVGRCHLYDSHCAVDEHHAFCASSTVCLRPEVNCCDGNLCNNEHIDKEYDQPVQVVITNVKEYEPKTSRDERPPPVVPHRHHVRTDTGYHAALKCYTGYFEKTLTVERCDHTYSHCAVDEHRAYCASSTVCSRDNVYCCDRSMCNRERLNRSSSGTSIITALFTLLGFRIFG